MASSVTQVTIIYLLRTLKPTPLPLSGDPIDEAYLTPRRQPSRSVYLHKKYIQVVPNPAIQTSSRPARFHPLSPLQDSCLISRPGRSSRPGKQNHLSIRRSTLPHPRKQDNVIPSQTTHRVYPSWRWRRDQAFKAVLVVQPCSPHMRPSPSG